MADIMSTLKTPIQAGLGILQSFQANKLKKDADAAAPPLVDPTQAQFLSELNQKRASLDAGTAYATGLNNLRATNAGTNNAIVQAGGGDVAGTIQGLIQSQRATGDSANQLNAQGQQEQNFNNSMYNELLNKVAARKMQLQLQASQQKRAEWAAKQQSANQVLGAAFGGLTLPSKEKPKTEDLSNPDISDEKMTGLPQTEDGTQEATGPMDAGVDGASNAFTSEAAGATSAAGGAADLALLAI